LNLCHQPNTDHEEISKLPSSKAKDNRKLLQLVSMSSKLPRWLHQNGTEVKHSLETQIPIGSTFITIGIQRSQCRPNSSQNNTDDHSQNQVQFRLPMKFFETYEFSPQLTTRSSRKPISSPRRHNRTQTPSTKLLPVAQMGVVARS
ncbi:hypothetical protein HID58_002486, partial [Brassica napus]